MTLRERGGGGGGCATAGGDPPPPPPRPEVSGPGRSAQPGCPRCAGGDGGGRGCCELPSPGVLPRGIAPRAAPPCPLPEGTNGACRPPSGFNTGGEKRGRGRQERPPPPPPPIPPPPPPFAHPKTLFYSPLAVPRGRGVCCRKPGCRTGENLRSLGSRASPSHLLRIPTSVAQATSCWKTRRNGSERALRRCLCFATVASPPPTQVGKRVPDLHPSSSRLCQGRSGGM